MLRSNKSSSDCAKGLPPTRKVGLGQVGTIRKAALREVRTPTRISRAGMAATIPATGWSRAAAADPAQMIETMASMSVVMREAVCRRANCARLARVEKARCTNMVENTPQTRAASE